MKDSKIMSWISKSQDLSIFLAFYIVSGIILVPGFHLCFVIPADHLVNEFDQIKSISAFKDVHSNTGIFGIHTSTVSIILTCTS